MNGFGAFVDVAFGIQEALELAPRETAVHHLDASNFDDAVALRTRESGGFGVQNYLTHIISVARQDGLQHSIARQDRL